MSGEYQIGAGDQWMEDGQLRWFDVNTTDMACQLSKDSWFYGLLDNGVAATVKDSWLVLARGETTIVLKQVAESDPPERVPAGEPSTIESLDGRSFESVSVIGRRLVKPIEISFQTGKLNRRDDEGNQVVGNGLGAYLGCNSMGGEYSIEDGQLRWFDVISTLVGCYGGGNERDTWFYELLNQGVDVSESEAGLIFDSGSTQIVFKET
jgi:heat shock protein HslJ